jgi:hypothetical protein
MGHVAACYIWAFQRTQEITCWRRQVVAIQCVGVADWPFLPVCALPGVSSVHVSLPALIRRHFCRMITIGVLSLQGSFREHIVCLRACNVESCEVRTLNELNSCDGLIIPGGESTTMAYVAEKSGILEGIRRFVIEEQKPVWGTCAGLIFLAESAEGAVFTASVSSATQCGARPAWRRPEFCVVH